MIFKNPAASEEIVVAHGRLPFPAPRTRCVKKNRLKFLVSRSNPFIEMLIFLLTILKYLKNKYEE